jgi:serine/threonine protein kinase
MRPAFPLRLPIPEAVSWRLAMTPERYRRLCELFDQALQRPPAERAAFLDQACAGDAALRAELDAMLRHDERAQGEKLFQEPCPVTGDLIPSAEEADDPLVGGRVGPYVVLERLGSGGMGSVYQAMREDAYRQQVALKVIRPGLDGAEVVRRFHAERQALADLEHAHIARLLDGGTTAVRRPTAGPTW